MKTHTFIIAIYTHIILQILSRQSPPAVFMCNNIQTLVYDAFLLFPNRSEIAHVEEFSTRNMKALFMIEERTNH